MIHCPCWEPKHKDNDDSRASGWTAKQQWVFKQHNSSAGLPPDCLAHYAASAQQWKCFFAQYVAPFIRTPLFALQPMYDAYQTGSELKSTDPAKVNAYGANLTATLKSVVLSNPANGAYLDGCWHHGGGWPAMQAQAESDQSWASPIQAFTDWYTAAAARAEAGAALSSTRYWQTPATGTLPNGQPASAFPCRACCPCAPNRTSANFNQGCKKETD